jgi:hypothetical protein
MYVCMYVYIYAPAAAAVGSLAAADILPALPAFAARTPTRAQK